MSENILNKSHDEVAGDNPGIPIDRVKILVSEATVSSHTDTERSAVIDRTVERRVEPSKTDLKLHALNYAMANTYVIERAADALDTGVGPKPKPLTPVEYTNTVIEVAEIYLAWLQGGSEGQQ